MPSAVSQKWLAMHLKCPSRMMDLFTAVAIWLEKRYMFSSWILRNVGILLEDFSNLVCSFKFQISTQLFMSSTEGFPNKKFEVLVLLLPVAIVSPYAAWKAWHPKFEPLASPPKIEFKSIEVPFFVVGISCGFVFRVFSS